MRKAKQRCKNSDNIEEVYIQLRFPDHSQLNKLKRGRKKNLNNTKTYGAKKKKKKSFCSKKWFIKSLRVFNVIDSGFDYRQISF